MFGREASALNYYLITSKYPITSDGWCAKLRRVYIAWCHLCALNWEDCIANLYVVIVTCMNFSYLLFPCSSLIPPPPQPFSIPVPSFFLYSLVQFAWAT